VRLLRLVLWTVGTRIAAAAAILLAVLQILDLLDITTEILDRGLGIGGVAHYAMLRLPRLIEQVAPLCVLAGGLFAFVQLAQESAVITLRAAGISVYRLVFMAMPAALCVALVSTLVVEVVAPRTDAALQAWWRDTGPPVDRKAPETRLFRVDGELVLARLADDSGRRLAEVEIFRRDDKGRLTEHVEADAATYRAPGDWRLLRPHVVRYVGDDPQVFEAEEMVWAASLRPADARSLLSDQPTPSAASARRALTGGGAERPASYYATRLQRGFAGPFAILVMLLIAAPVALGNFRNQEGALLTAAALGAGLVFLVADGLLAALGESAALSPVLGAWTAPLVMAALATTQLLRMEG
jgi:lipopolysaccharide export system permease protein